MTAPKSRKLSEVPAQLLVLRFDSQGHDQDISDQRSITVDPGRDPQFQKAWNGRAQLLRQRRLMELVNLSRRR